MNILSSTASPTAERQTTIFSPRQTLSEVSAFYPSGTSFARVYRDGQALRSDTLEAVDISLNLIEKYSDTFQLATTADEVLAAVKAGKVASLLGVEG